MVLEVGMVSRVGGIFRGKEFRKTETLDRNEKS